MDRRVFLGGLAFGTVAVARFASAQPAPKVARIGLLSAGYTTSDMGGPQPRSPVVKALLRGLRDLGYVYGEQFVTGPRGGDGGPERYPGLAAELVRLQVDVIVAAGPLLGALKPATSTIPIVMAGAEDPVGLGLIRSLAHPGENFTGLSNQAVELAAMRLELRKEIVPGVAPVAVLWDRAALLSWQAAKAAAREGGWKLLSLEVRHVGDIDGALKAATRARGRSPS